MTREPFQKSQKRERQNCNDCVWLCKREEQTYTFNMEGFPIMCQVCVWRVSSKTLRVVQRKGLITLSSMY